MRTVDDGSELFGSSTRLPSGEFAENGFEALGAYDLPELGGDGDGVISKADLVWPHLRIWVDENHDGQSQRPEIRTLGAHGVVSIGLGHEEVNVLDGHLNLHAQRGRFVVRARVFGGMHLREQIVDDIYFISSELAEEW